MSACGKNAPARLFGQTNSGSLEKTLCILRPESIECFDQELSVTKIPIGIFVERKPIGQITPSVAGQEKLASRHGVFLEKRHAGSALRRRYRGHESRRARSDHADLHFSAIRTIRSHKSG